MAYIIDFQPLCKVERITGLTVVIFEGSNMVAHDEDGLIHWEARFHASRAGVDRAADSIIDRNYAAMRRRVFAEQGGKCAECGKFRPLECDHRNSRGSNGRDDRRENLQGLCNPCHEKKHRGFTKRVRQIGEL